MKSIPVALNFAGIIALMWPGIAVAQDCNPTPSRHAVSIKGINDQGELSAYTDPEIAGERNFFQSLENGWVFAMLRTEHGWAVRIFDREPIADGTDLTAFTPPLRSTPNPRDIEGWHFRNKDNTAPNEGDINAPQHRRSFIISPGLVGTAGPRFSDGTWEPGPDDGLGLLEIVDFGLANPVPGQKARMNYLKFNACLTWPRSDEDRAYLEDRASLEFIPEEIEIFGACGLPLQTYTLDARYAPRTLGGDLDGDGALDEVAQIRRLTDDRRAIALCRAGTWIDVIGLNAQPVGDLKPGFTDQVEAWQWITPGGERPRHLVGYDLPQADGDILVLERVEKEALLIFWRDGALRTKRLYGHVEP